MVKIFHNITIFTVFFYQLNAALVSIRDFFLKQSPTLLNGSAGDISCVWLMQPASKALKHLLHYEKISLRCLLYLT